MKAAHKLLLAVAALGLLAAAGFKDQAGPRISGLFFTGPVYADTACRVRGSCKVQAREKRLYEISARTLILAETLAACANHEITCTEEDGRALKAHAEKTLQDLMGLIKSGDTRALAVTAEEGEALLSWSKEVRGRFSRIEMPEGTCNSARMLVSAALQLLQTVIA
jgi:hypothetical protein